MEEAHGNPEIEEQLISIGTIIITNAHIFADAVEKWNLTPAAKKVGSISNRIHHRTYQLQKISPNRDH